MSAEDAAKANIGGLVSENREEARKTVDTGLHIAPEQAAENVVVKGAGSGDDSVGSPFAYSPQFIIGRAPVAPAAEPVQMPYGQGAGSSTYSYGPTGGGAPSRSMPFMDEDARPVEETLVEETSAVEAPVEETTVEEAPVEEAPVEEAPVEEAPVEETTVEEAPVEENPMEKFLSGNGEVTEDDEVLDSGVEDLFMTVDETEEVIDLTEIDFRDADFVHEVDLAMVEKFSYYTEAVKVSEKAYVGRTFYMLKIVPMSSATRRSYRVREKNLVYNGEELRCGVRVPYTKEEYAALTRKQRKTVLAQAKEVLEYNRTCAQIALLQVLKSDQVKFIDKMKVLEERLEDQRELLPTSERWKACIKEK